MQHRYLINSPALSEIVQDARHLEELANSLAAFLENQRWFAAKTDGIQSVKILDSVEIPGEATAFELVLATVVTNGGSSDCYALPITSALQNDAQSADAIIAGLSSDDGSTASPTSLVECSSNPEFWRAITASLAARTLTTRNGRELKLSRTANSRLGSGELFGNSEFTIHDGEQSNSAVAIGDDFFLKLFRRPRVGHNPDAEVGIFLTDRTDFRNSPRVDATIDIVGPDGNRCLALISEQVSAETDAWSYTLDSLKDYWTRLAELVDRPEVPPGIGVALREDSTFEKIREDFDSIGELIPKLLGQFHQDVAQLGRRTAELHTALTTCHDDPAFAPELLTQDLLNRFISQLRKEVQTTCGLLEKTHHDITISSDLPSRISDRANRFLDRMSTFDAAKANVVSIRCHGDYHLGQVLRTVSDFVILDFEGEPDRPFNERRQKRCAMKDVAGMIRSFHYASCTTAVGMLPPPDANITNAEKWQTFWYDNARVGFLAGYKLESEGKPFLPTDDSSFQQLLDLFLIEKVLYELRYEINNRPDWVKIPLAGLNAVLGLIA
jgi:maltose alpha-D-glucosyltransferase/alpha-amylase